MKFSKLFFAGGLLFSAIAFASCSSTKTVAIEQGWDLLGESTVNFVRDRDAVTVYSNERYTAIRFQVQKREIKLSELKILYPNGDKLDPAVDDILTPGQYSREIQLGPEGKDIRTIEFSYRTTGNLLKGRAKVLVFGKRYIPPVYNPNAY